MLWNNCGIHMEWSILIPYTSPWIPYDKMETLTISKFLGASLGISTIQALLSSSSYTQVDKFLGFKWKLTIQVYNDRQ